MILNRRKIKKEYKKYINTLKSGWLYNDNNIMLKYYRSILKMNRIYYTPFYEQCKSNPNRYNYLCYITCHTNFTNGQRELINIMFTYSDNDANT